MQIRQNYTRTTTIVRTNVFLSKITITETFQTIDILIKPIIHFHLINLRTEDAVDTTHQQMSTPATP